MPTLVSLSLAAAITLALMIGGCGKPAGDVATEQALRASTGHDASSGYAGDQASAARQEGRARDSAGDDIALPDDFPADVYLPANHYVHSVMDIDDARLVSVTTTGNPAALQDEVSAAMRSNGWKQVMVMANEQARMLSFQKDQRAATITLIPAEHGQVQFNVQLATRSP